MGVLFLGSEGYMEIPNYGMYRTFLGKKKEPGPTARQEGDHFANFIQAVRNRRSDTLNAEIEEGRLSSGLVHLANISYRLGRSLVFDPRTEQFPGDDEANLLRSREYRSPYSIMENN
ncbi:MAG: hypothetical protein DMG05_04670 [Acidobacteria bacterium]|nr:MAG: hypothetical protein DMG05_04670 [Acidobacteriota bacterium]